MDHPPACFTAEDCARELRLSTDHFRHKVATLIEKHGFPPKLPGLGLRWSRAQVLSWCAGHNAEIEAPAPNEPPPAPTNVTLISEARQRLLQRYAGGA